MALFSGCTSAQFIQPNVQVLDSPPLGSEKTVELGDTLVSKGKVFTYDAVRLENKVSAGDGFLLKKFTLSPSVLAATMFDDEWLYYSSDKLEVYDAMLGTQRQTGGLAISKTDPHEIKFWWLGGRRTFKPKPDPILTKTTTPVLDRPSFKQELIYNGRSGDTLKFLYREYSNDFLRAPFSQEVQYDLKDGHTIGFKGARIDVIKATNTELTYRVVSSFPDAP